MALKTGSLVRAFLLALLVTVGAAGSARAQDVANLSRVGVELARFNKPGAFYGYLRDYNPRLFALADKAGLASVLDGKLSQAEFTARLNAALVASGLPESDQKKCVAEAVSLGNILTVFGTSRTNKTPVLGLSAEDMKKGGNLIPELRRGLFTAENHWISKTWSPDKRGSVGIKFVPGKLGWFNPSVSIPELGIRAGVPLTEAQKEAVVALFSFETVPNAPGTADGTAAFPEHVGRAVNPNSHVLTVLNDRGEVIGDLTAKGAGPNKPNATRDGRLDTSEAFLDSEVSRNLYRNGVKNYDALAVILPDATPGKAITIRAPRSMMRHLDMDKLDDKELKATLERFTREIAIREGKPKLTIGEWLKTYLPRVSGENWGLLNGLGVEHGSSYTRDNHGLGETVDWGWVALRAPGNADQKEGEWDNVKETIERVNKILPDAEKVDVAAAKSIFDAAYEAARVRATKMSVKLDPATLEKMSDSDLKTLASKTIDPNKPGDLGYGASRAEILARLEASGHVASKPSVEALVRLPASKLVEMAHENGWTVPTNAADRATVIASITGKPHADVVREIAKSRTTTTGTERTASDGLTERLRGMIRDRVANKDRVRAP